MVTTFHYIGEPEYKNLFNLREKIYYEIVQRLIRIGKKYTPHYFIRGMTGFILENYNKKDLIGVEIGTQLGYNAIVMLSVLPIKKLYCIDPYVDYFEDVGEIKSRIVNNNTLDIAKNNLSMYLDKVIFLKDYSYNTVKFFEDNSLDFVYIDGNHSYDCVKKDIELYLPKVKKNGFLGGHDFDNRYLGVIQAVFDFIDKYGYKLFLGRNSDWWIIK